MYRTIIALGLVAIGTVPAARTSVPTPLAAATVARIRAESQQLAESARRDRAAAGRALRSTPPTPALTPRPPKTRPRD
jgi:hypothetical protein